MGTSASGCNGSPRRTSDGITAVTILRVTFWQGRFKSFPIQSDEHLLTVMHYVERNPVRAKSIPVRKAQNWPWSSVGARPKNVEKPELDPGPVPRRSNWLDWVNRLLTKAERDAMRECISRGQPYGAEKWKVQAAKRHRY